MNAAKRFTPDKNTMSLPLRTLLSTALKSLFLEAAWNSEGQQNLGFAAALDGALVRLHQGDPEALGRARARVSQFFNTHPVMSGPALGVALNLEEQLGRGQLDEARYQRLMSSLTSALAAVGDAFFWGAYLPLCLVAAMWAILVLRWPWGALLVPITFSFLHLPIRFGGFFLGYRRGLALFQWLDRLRLPRWALTIKKISAVVLGALTVLIINQTGLAPKPSDHPRLWLLSALTLVVLSFFIFLLRRVGRLEIWLYALLTLTFSAAGLAALL